MHAFLKLGRLFYGVGIIADGVQQILIQDFRPQLIPIFPAWVHTFSIFPVVTGLAMILCGAVIMGLMRLKAVNPGKICLYLGFYFLTLIITCHIPYLLFVYPHKLSHLGSWGDLLKELAFCGGAFVMAGSYRKGPSANERKKSVTTFLQRFIPAGRLFFCTTMILFGCCHFAYTPSISLLVPKWFGIPVFWTYFGGVMLIGAGIAIVCKIFLKPVALLLATMLFLWFLLLHVPGAIAHPALGRGNLVVSAFDALLFCGTALVLSQSSNKARDKVPETVWPESTMERTLHA